MKNIRTLPVKFDERHNSSYLVRSVVREHLLHSAKPILPLNEALLREGLVGSVVRDAVQFVVAGAAEYGLGALTLPAAGAGLAAGPAAETMVDAAFSSEAIAGAIAGIADIRNELGEFGELWSEAVEAYGGDLTLYYKKLVILVQKALTILGEKAENKVEALADALQQKMEDLVRRLSRTVKSGVKLVIPDASIGLAIAKGFETVMLSLAKQSFDILAKVVNAFDLFKRFVDDPSIAVDFFKDVFLQVVDLMNAASEKLTDMSWLKAILLQGGSPVGAIALKKLGPIGLKKAADVIKAQLPMILKAVDGVLTVLVPTTITAVGLYQIMMRDDWKPKKTPQGPKKLAASYNRRGPKMKISKRQLRRIIKEEIDDAGRNYGMD